jgi:hypothetical protein
MLSMTRLRALCFGLALSLASCGRTLSPAECDSLLDRYVEKLVGSDRPDTPASELVELQRRAREKASRDPAFAECKKAVSRKQFECAMQAETVDRMEICLL